MARPTDMTKEIIDKLEVAYSMDCTDIEACLYAGISHQTLYNYQKKFPEFVERKQALKNKPFLLARNTMMRGIKEDFDFALKYMERKKKDEFSLKEDRSDPSQVNTQVNLFLNKSNDQLIDCIQDIRELAPEALPLLERSNGPETNT